ncbi:conjugal transfer protein TraB [Pseudomonas tritici]|uniref:conjugal transfer protein TraB n=1 Tax=Pseudomonas tritici TaxID=2745518 RepID=UPI00387B1353
MSNAPETANSNPALNKKNLAIAGIIAIGLAFTFLGGKDKEAVKVDVSDKPIELGSDPINTISVKDKDASLTVFAKQFETVEQKFTINAKDAAERDSAIRREIKDGNNVLKAQVAALTDAVTSMQANGIEGLYKEANKNDSKTLQSIPTPIVPNMPSSMPDLSMDGGLNFDGLDFNMSAPKPMSQASGNGRPNQKPSYGPNYFILKPDSATSASDAGSTVSRKSGGDSLNASESDLFTSMSTPSSQGASGNHQPQQAQQEPQKQYDSAAEAYENQQNESKTGNTQANSGPKMQRITIPAFSYVEVTTLHGVACPIGANSPNSKAQSEIPARPVVLPVRGIYRGPNGSSVDTGTVHLMALCSGRRTTSTSSGRATLRVEQMSYWDEGGDAQMTAATGYIVDTRDNEQDVYGRLDKASGRTLALESFAAAGAAFAAALSQSEFTTQNNMSTNGNGTSTVSQLTGDATKAATAQGVAAIFTRIADRFQQEANAAIDTVVVEPGIRLRFVTDQPIHIYKPAEAFDLDAGKSDLLL